MQLGLNLGTWGPEPEAFALAEEADRLGYAVCWVAEAYGSDAPTMLATIAARTERIDVGSAVMQIPARTPAATAMTAATLDLLSGGRFRLGLGVSGPQVSEGWHGVRFAHPLGRTKEYIEVVRAALRRERLSYAGRHITLPLPDGPGKALRLALRPRRPDLPIYLASVGPTNLELTGRIADGWLGVFASPDSVRDSIDRIERGRADRADPDENSAARAFDAVLSVPIVVGDDPAECADATRAYTALYVGGMGSKKENYYNAAVRRMGYEQAAEEVQNLYLAGTYREAAAALPRGLLDDIALLGPPDRIAERAAAFAEAGVTTLAVIPMGATPEARLASLRTLADAFA